MRAALLRSLCSVADSGGEPSSFHTAHGEPFLRPLVRASVRRAIARAAAATTVADPEHVARLALLVALDAAKPIDPNDPQAVAFAYEAAAGSWRRASGGPWPISLALLVCALGALGAFLWVRLRPTPEDSFMRSPLGKALSEPLGAYVTALDRGPREIAERREDVLTSGVRKQLGGELADQLENALLEAEKTKKGASDGEGLRAAIEALDDGFAKARVPAFLDAYHRDEGTRRSLWLMAFYTEERARVTVRGGSLSVAHVRRLDSLNLETSFVAWRREHSDWLAVSVDLLEVELAKEYLPSLGGDRDLVLSERASAPKLGELAGELTRALRAAYPAAAKVDPGEIHDVRELADRRQASVVRLLEKKQVLMGEGALLLTPPRYDFLAKYRAKERDVDDFLETHDRMKLHREAIGRLTAVLGGIMEEELAAGALLQRAKIAPTPAALAEGIGEVLITYRGAALMLFADPRNHPAIVLERLCRESARGNAAPYEAVLAIAGELGAPKDALDGTWDEALLLAARTILGKPPADVRAAAGRVWARWIGGEIPPYERKAL